MSIGASPAITMEGPACQLSSCSADDLGSKGAPVSTAPAVVLTLLAGGPGSADEPRTRRIGPVRHARASPVCRVMTVVGMRSAEECYRSVRRYSAGVMPMARRNARVKLDCEENRHSRAISLSDARPVAIIALAVSSRRRLT
jgi:hypothetical protein